MKTHKNCYRPDVRSYLLLKPLQILYKFWKRIYSVSEYCNDIITVFSNHLIFLAFSLKISLFRKQKIFLHSTEKKLLNFIIHSKKQLKLKDRRNLQIMIFFNIIYLLICNLIAVCSLFKFQNEEKWIKKKFIVFITTQKLTETRFKSKK